MFPYNSKTLKMKSS